MKFWELISSFREFDEQLSLSLQSDRWITPYGEWFRNYDRLVAGQDRTKLDASVPEELVLEIADNIGDLQVFYLDGCWLRRKKQSSGDIKLNAVEVINRFGGSVIEEVLEYGSCQVKT